MLSDSFDLPESLVTAARKVLEGKEQVEDPADAKKKELDEKKEVIIFDPEVDPNALSQPDSNKPMKTT